MKKFQSLLRLATRKQVIRSFLKLPLRAYSTDSESRFEKKLKADPRGTAMDLFLTMLNKVGEREHEWPIMIFTFPTCYQRFTQITPPSAQYGVVV